MCLGLHAQTIESACEYFGCKSIRVAVRQSAPEIVRVEEDDTGPSRVSVTAQMKPGYQVEKTRRLGRGE